MNRLYPDPMKIYQKNLLLATSEKHVEKCVLSFVTHLNVNKFLISSMTHVPQEDSNFHLLGKNSFDGGRVGVGLRIDVGNDWDSWSSDFSVRKSGFKLLHRWAHETCMECAGNC